MVEASTGYGEGVTRHVAKTHRGGVDTHKGLWNLMLLLKLY